MTAATDINYSALLRQLVDAYLEKRISRVEYLAQRRRLLDQIDREFNGEVLEHGGHTPDATRPAPSSDDITAPRDRRFFR